jgi:hypothetical protein
MPCAHPWDDGQDYGPRRSAGSPYAITRVAEGKSRRAVVALAKACRAPKLLKKAEGLVTAVPEARIPPFCVFKGAWLFGGRLFARWRL